MSGQSTSCTATQSCHPWPFGMNNKCDDWSGGCVDWCLMNGQNACIDPRFICIPDGYGDYDIQCCCTG